MLVFVITYIINIHVGTKSAKKILIYNGFLIKDNI